MKTLFPFIIVSCLLSLAASPAHACPMDPSDENLQALRHWVCELESELARKDQSKNYVRQVHLITDNESIKSIRDLIVSNDDDVCRNFPAGDAVHILKRILSHQDVSDSFPSELSQSAAGDIAASVTGRSVTSCESQILTEHGVEVNYASYYYLKFGSTRQGKHLIIKVVTSWES